ncbi:hypothetical protein VOLCADRAFT_86899 [Volvox carteri f. nagariensis]|uniref:Uncharacterized protein n=1 Tax=Volvox carteri f. nagariensis TaxID=3068 RepID=D8TKN2_VOLCA|nr:uncharacterized protein VOLCADRAFT_86899 [Volvox carteri f. nagariensis]EFJ51915.1 hypothetical protein VOLCADRAFT_86899 [Volvox carteri f. nagariensis]|eukprot:XP_002946689.1 hypothetical protein VOLCADRAFT_86899 [Volvox carteri f. nagariensis]
MAYGGPLDAHGQARLQAELAAALERADRAEVQLRTATDESSRLSDRIELLQQELADAKRDLAKSREETVAVTALAATHGARAGKRSVELDREATALREKLYHIEMDISAMTAERDGLQSELAGAHINLDDMASARNQLANQLEDAAKQLARSSAAAAAAEDRHKAEMQQLQLRLATLEAEFRAINHAKGTIHEDLQRARGDALALQAQLQEESRQREEQVSECRRLQRELDVGADALAQAQRSQRSAIAKSDELEVELERLHAAYSALEADLQTAKERVEKMQDEVRLTAERNTELAGQVHSLTASLRHLEVENARLTDGHAMLKVEIEARAAEARAARGEAAELAADRARLLAEMQQRHAAAGAENEVSQLREALTASRLDVAQLQKELAANDAVLADAESALVALVSEKESLQQALDDALMSQRVAARAAEELRAQVAAQSARDAAAQDANTKTAAKQAAALASGNGVDQQQRMMSYLQSLSEADTTGGPIEGVHDNSGATTPAAATPGPGRTTSAILSISQEESVRITVEGAVNDAFPLTSSRSNNGVLQPIPGLKEASSVTASAASGVTNIMSPSPRSSLLQPSSPHGSTIGELHEQADGSSSEPSLGRGDLGPVLQSAANPQSSAANAAWGSNYKATSKVSPENRPPASISESEISLTPHPEMHRNPPRASFNLGPYNSLPPSAAAPPSPSGRVSPAGGNMTATGSGPTPSGATGYSFPALSASRGADATVFPHTGPTSASADVGSTLQTTAYRSPTRQTPPSDIAMSHVAVASASPTGNLRQQPSRSQQPTPASQTYYRPGTADMVLPDVSGFPSPFASGNAAAVISSPRTSGTVGTSAPSSPPKAPASPPAIAPVASPGNSGTVGMVASTLPPSSAAGLEPLSRRLSLEQQQQQLGGSHASASRPSFSLAFTRRTTIMQEAGLVGVEAISAPVHMVEDAQTPRRTGDKFPAPAPREAAADFGYPSSALLAQAPSEEDLMLIKRLAAMDEALRAIGAI